MPGSGLLPFRAPPLPQELLSSWIIRLCLGLGCELQAFTTQILGTTMLIWNRDVDRQIPESAVLELSRRTALGRKVVQGLTLQSYAGTIFRPAPRSGPLRWVLPVVDYQWKKEKPGMQYCEDCLAEDLVPYFRKFWRLGFFTFCPHHLKVLQEGCPSCGVSPLPVRRNFSDNPSRVTPLHVCASCLTDLREKVPRANLRGSSVALRTYTDFLLRIERASFGTDLDIRFFDNLYRQTRGYMTPNARNNMESDSRRKTVQNGTVQERYKKTSSKIAFCLGTDLRGTRRAKKRRR
jgi:hypothetical protein